MAKSAPPRSEPALERYRKKRDFSLTPEPEAGSGAGDPAFCVQQHAARRMHFDLRLEMDGVLKSWAVPQGPSLDTKVKRLAVHTEDHPLDYLHFEGVIPDGQYGAGRMIVWDLGTWVAMGDPEDGYRKGSLKFRLLGEKLRGGWTLVRIKGRRERDERADNWLLIKERDLEARPASAVDIVAERPESVISGRTVDGLGHEETKPRERPQHRPLRLEAVPGARKASLDEPPQPQLAASEARPPEGDDWLHEIKLDGYRTLVRIDGAEVSLHTRSGHDWTDRYGDLGRAFRGLACTAALIDGEVVVQDASGRSSFAALQDALAEGTSHVLTFFAFDLLHLDGYELREVPLIERKGLLQALIAPALGQRSALQFSEHLKGQGLAFFDEAARLGLEGVISKRADAPYRSGRTRTWLKAKCLRRDDFPIIGFTTSEAAGGLAALLVAEADEDGLRYAGRVGTGFSADEAERLRSRLKPLVRKTPPVRLPPEDRRRDVTFVRPALLAEVEYLTRTADGLLRQAAYKGLRSDLSGPVTERSSATLSSRDGGAEVTRPPRLVSDADLASIWVTNPDRRMFASDGPTKLDLALYYAQIGDWMLPEVLNRPVSLVRCPDGRLASTFFQRHAMAGMPPSIRTVGLAEDDEGGRGDYLYLEDARGFLALPQFGAIELHTWGCRVDQPERPDRIVFDLDPDEGLPFRAVTEAALLIKDSLRALGLIPFVKTTGGKGLHVVVPLSRRQSWPMVAAFCQAFAAKLAAEQPRRLTTNMAKRERRGRIYLDYLRNTRGATAVAAYSLRARPGVPVSTPLGWQEVETVEDPADFTYATVPGKVEAGPDPWATLDASGHSLTKEMQRAVGIRA